MPILIGVVVGFSFLATLFGAWDAYTDPRLKITLKDFTILDHVLANLTLWLLIAGPLFAALGLGYAAYLIAR